MKGLGIFILAIGIVYAIRLWGYFSKERKNEEQK